METISKITFDNSIVYNGNNFISGNANTILITGHSGSGKTTLSFILKDLLNTNVIQLDLFSHWLEYQENPKNHLNKIKDYNYFPKILNEYFTQTYGSNLDTVIIKKIRSNESRYYKELLKMVKFFINNTNSKYIIEGVDIPNILLLDRSILDKSALIFINKPIWIILYNRIKRDYKHSIELINLFTNYIYFFKKYKILKNILKMKCITNTYNLRVFYEQLKSK